jgi:hypothetical protein
MKDGPRKRLSKPNPARVTNYQNSLIVTCDYRGGESIVTLLVVVWIIDIAILLYFVQLLARLGPFWQGANSIITLLTLDFVAMMVSALLVWTSPTPRTRRLAATIAGAMPLVGAIAFIGVGLVIAISILMGGKWN